MDKAMCCHRQHPPKSRAVMFKLRDYQEKLSTQGAEIVTKLGIVCLSMEVRTGKTFTALEIARKVGAESVLFITKKKPITSGTIMDDYITAGHTFLFDLINYESVHKVTGKYDMIIIDEFHSLGAFPKASLRTKRIKELFTKNKPKYHVMLSGSPSPESYSQLYHPFWINSLRTPFTETSFYKWAATYVTITKRFVAHGNQVNDYSNANIKQIKAVLDKYFLSYTQSQAGFTSKVDEVFHTVQMEDRTYNLIRKLKADKVLQNDKGDTILGDTPVKLMQKCHQLYSGTVITEEGKYLVLDKSKLDYINTNIEGKMAIFYKYKAELTAIEENIHNVTTDIYEFNNSDKHIALQIVSGREGISLKKADCLVMYNIDFSNLSYIQAKDRLTTKERKENTVHWIFSKNGIEKEIYKVITKDKAKYNTVHFTDARSQNTSKAH